MLNIIKYPLQDKDDAITVATGGISLPIQAQRDAAKEQKKSRRAQQRLQNIKAARERRQAARQARIARAQIESRATAAGTTGSSGFAGGMGNIQQQLASNLSFLNQAQALTKQQSIFEQRAANDLSRAATYQSAIDLGMKSVSLFAGGGS